MNIRPSDIDLLSRVFQAFDSAPVAFFENVPSDRIAQLKNAARGLPVKFRFGSGSSTSIETLAFGFACNYALSKKRLLASGEGHDLRISGRSSIRAASDPSRYVSATGSTSTFSLANSTSHATARAVLVFSILSPPFLCYNVSVRSLLAAVSFENRCALAVSSNSRQVRRLFCRHTPFCERR